MEQPLAKIKAVFDQVLEMEAAAERAAYLDRACANAPDLRQQVEALLRAYDDAGNFLQGPAPLGTARMNEPLAERPLALQLEHA